MTRLIGGEMDQVVALLSALRTAQHLFGSSLSASRVEELASGLRIQPEALPAMMARLQRDGAISLMWGGSVEVMPERRSETVSQVINVGPGGAAQVAGRDLAVGTVNVNSPAAMGELLAVLDQLRTLKLGLPPELVTVAATAETALTRASSAETPAAERPGLIQQALQSMSPLLTAAPQVKDLIEVIEKLQSAFS